MKRVINADNAKFDIAEVNFAVAFGKKFVREDSNEVKRFKYIITETVKEILHT